MHEGEIIELMERAVQSLCGLALTVTDVEVFKRKWYAARTTLRTQEITRYDGLSLRIPANPQEVWIIKRTVDAPDERGSGEGNSPA